MSIARDLYQLQETDVALETNEQAQVRINHQLGDNQVVVKAKTAVAVEQKKLEDLAKQQKTTEWEIDDLTTKIKAIEKKLYDGKITNSKELSNLQTESQDFKKTCSGLEDRVLELMEQIEFMSQNVAAANAEVARIEAQWQAQQRQLAGELEQLKANHTALETKRQSLLPQIAADAVEIYLQLRKRKGVAVARVEQGTCLGCRIHVPNADLQMAKGGGIVRCSSCGRILFLA